jgi:hypothetical protein
MLLSGDRNIFGNYEGAPYNSTYGNGYGSISSGAAHSGTGPYTGAETYMGTAFVSSATSPTWTDKVHQQAGNLGLADGSVQEVSSSGLRNQLRNTEDTTSTPGPNTIMFP